VSSVMASHHGGGMTPLGAMEAEMHELPLPGMHKQAAQPKKEYMANHGAMPPTVSQAYAQQQAMAAQMQGGKGQDCWALPPPSSGCDPIVGYNAPYDCVCGADCVADCDKKGRTCLCTGVATWKNELNAQGMNYPMGAPSHNQVGASF
jgi:hypothetical protein